MIDEDKNIYFIHIAGTGGRSLKEYVLNPLLNKNAKIVGKHNGWSNSINDSTYIISIFREPVKHACGFYLHFLYKKKYGTDIKKLFLEHYRNSESLYNFQSKNFIIAGQAFNYGTGKYFNSDIIEIDEDLLEKRVSRIDLLISQDLLFHDIQYVANILAEDLDLHRIQIDNVDKYKHVNGMSADLYNSLTENEKEEIKRYNSIDYKIYSQLRLKEIEKRGDYEN